MPLNVDSLNSGTIKTESLTVAGESVGPKYKVYTALLTQNGGDVDSFLIDNGLVIGITYRITPYGNTIGVDFTNIGAPNNDAGTYFVATGTIPNSWGNNTDDSPVLQYNTGAPVVTVLENTIGNVWFNYLEVGKYEINLSNPIDIDKTFLYIGNGPTVNQLVYFEEAGIKTITFYGFSGSESKLMIYSSLDGYNSFVDGRCNNTPIEIRVYN